MLPAPSASCVNSVFFLLVLILINENRPCMPMWIMNMYMHIGCILCYTIMFFFFSSQPECEWLVCVSTMSLNSLTKEIPCHSFDVRVHDIKVICIVFFFRILFDQPGLYLKLFNQKIKVLVIGEHGTEHYLNRSFLSHHQQRKKKRNDEWKTVRLKTAEWNTKLIWHCNGKH